MTRAEIVTARAGNPSWYGVRVEAGVTLTKTTPSGSIEVASYDDCPNQLDDEPGILLFSSTLSDKYTKTTMRTDTFRHTRGFKESRFFKQEVPSAALLIDAKEQTIHYEKTKYKIRVASSIPKPHKVTWFEEFTPEDSNPEDEVQPEKTLVVKTTTIIGAESPVYMIDPALTPDQEGSWRVFLLPFELNSDLNNDGKVGDAADSSLKATAQQSGASDEAKQKGTEYVFVNDHLSNGLWDKEDLDSTRPASENKDDDAKELKTVCLATWGSIWFEHPIISKLAFYKTKECNAADKLTFPFALSETNRFPEKLYVRAEEVTVQIEGELVMKFGKADKTETWAEDRLKFTVVKEVGDTKYFHAVRDYILENNTLLFTHRKGYPADEPETEFWICAMREEATKMEAVESFHRGAVKLYGISDVASSYSDLTVVTNGNQVFFSDGWGPSLFEPFDENHRMSDKCHGRLIYAGVSSPASSDKTDKTTVPFGSDLAGVDANYISQGTTGPFTLALGRVPSGSHMGLGGLSTDYGNSIRDNLPQTMVGYAPVLKDGEGVVFTASQPVTGGGDFGFPSGGHAPLFADDAHRSGVPAMPGAVAGRYKLLILDSGRTSVALAHVKPNNHLQVQFAGGKHTVGIPYYVNTYLGFRSTRPRTNP